MDALRAQVAVNIRKWGDGRKQKPWGGPVRRRGLGGVNGRIGTATRGSNLKHPKAGRKEKKLEHHHADCHTLSLCCLLYGFYFTGIKPNSLACWTAINKYFIVVFFE